MLPDEQPVEYILDGIDAVMASKVQPKVILFDIGGVVVSASDSFPQRLHQFHQSSWSILVLIS